MALNAMTPTAAALTPIPTFTPFESPPLPDATIMLEALLPVGETAEAVAVGVAAAVDSAESVRDDEAVVGPPVVGAGSVCAGVEVLDDVAVGVKLDAVES